MFAVTSCNRGVDRAARGIDFDDRTSGGSSSTRSLREAFNFDDPARDERRAPLLGGRQHVHVMTKADNMQKNWKLLHHWIASTGGCRLLPRRVDGRERKIKFSMYEPFWKLNSWSETSIQ